MIEGLQRQTDSSVASIRGYGCYFYSLMALWQNQHLLALSDAELSKIFDTCVAAGIIVDNKIPTTDAGWYRCFIKSPRDIFKVADGYTNKKTQARETYRSPTLIDTPAGQYTIIEWRTKTGSHFVVGIVNAKGVQVLYNPDPRIKSTTIKTIRHWEVI